jgi:hypothetical protein
MNYVVTEGQPRYSKSEYSSSDTAHLGTESPDYRIAKLMFAPHSNLSNEVNRNIVQSEIEGGVFLEGLPPDTVLQIQTQHHFYTAQLLGEGSALISGHPQFCPEPVQVTIAGSTWGGSMLKMRYIGRGMHLEFHHPAYSTPIVTSAIQEIRERVRSARDRRAGAGQGAQHSGRELGLPSA